MCPQLPLLSWGGVGGEGGNQTLSSSPNGSVFQTLIPRHPHNPSVRWRPGTQAPTAGKFLASSPQPIRQRQLPCQENIYRRKESPPYTLPLPHPLLPVPGKRGLSAPEAPLGPPVTDWESGNECSGKVPPPRVRPHHSDCWHATLPFNTVKAPTEAQLNLLSNGLDLCLASVCDWGGQRERGSLL